MTVCLRCRVHGRVQGVFFRASTQRHARQLGVTGYARNMPDGTVEVLACGDESAVEQLQAWLRQGPPGSRVSAVDCATAATAPPVDFTTA